MLKGMTPGAALVLLMAGPAVNVASLLVIRKVLGSQTLWLYLTAIVGGAIAFALGIDYLLPREWFTDSLILIQEACHTHTPWFNLICSAALLILLAYALISRMRKSQSCCETTCNNSNCCDTSTCSDATCHKQAPTAQTFIVTGMQCNHCRASVIRAISNLPGTESVDVDLASGRVIVTGTASLPAIVQAIETLGFGVVK
jgi:copper chaperone CopZ